MKIGISYLPLLAAGVGDFLTISCGVLMGYQETRVYAMSMLVPLIFSSCVWLFHRPFFASAPVPAHNLIIGSLARAALFMALERQPSPVSLLS